MNHLPLRWLALAVMLISTTGIARSQTSQRIIYDFTFQRDTSDVNSKTKDQYALDVFEHHSRFVSFTKLKQDIYLDSMTKAIEAQGGLQNIKSININRSNMGTGGIYEIYKFDDGKIRFQQKFLREIYGYEEDMTKLNWAITDHTEKYVQYNCQMAKLNYGGRTWNALFTTDIAINNGPYKFSGLPGLIVKMWDEKNHCLFELTEIKNITGADTRVPNAEIVKKEEFKKVEQNAQTQLRGVASGISPSSPGSGTVTMRVFKDQNGNDITPEQAQRRRAEAEKRNNNRLELN